MKWVLFFLMFPLISFAQKVDYIKEMENKADVGKSRKKPLQRPVMCSAVRVGS